jgi:hypothetical protein
LLETQRLSWSIHWRFEGFRIDRTRTLKALQKPALTGATVERDETRALWMKKQRRYEDEGASHALDMSQSLVLCNTS